MKIGLFEGAMPVDKGVSQSREMRPLEINLVFSCSMVSRARTQLTRRDPAILRKASGSSAAVCIGTTSTRALPGRICCIMKASFVPGTAGIMSPTAIRCSSGMIFLHLAYHHYLFDHTNTILLDWRRVELTMAILFLMELLLLWYV